MQYAIVDFTRQTTQFFDSFAAAEQAICEYEPLCSSSVVILDITEEFPQAEQMQYKWLTLAQQCASVYTQLTSVGWQRCNTQA